MNLVEASRGLETVKITLIKRIQVKSNHLPNRISCSLEKTKFQKSNKT